MNSRKDLLDSLHGEMVASKRPWSSEEIARTTLRLVSDSTRADRLVGAILGGDARFSRQGSFWRARSAHRPRLRDLSFLLAEVPPLPAAMPAPLWIRAVHPSGTARSDVLQVTPDGAGLDRFAELLAGRLPVSLTAAATRRAIHRFEQFFALPATSDRLIDLAAILRLLGRERPKPGKGIERRGGLEGRAEGETDEEGPEERLDACRRALDDLLALRGERSIEELEEEIERSQLADAVDFSSFRFGRELISLLPARPGVYRFLDEAGGLLYVGKSRDLGRRVASYFRPLAPDHTRRARLLAEIRDLEWETTPSELEALILEGETIRREHPPFNQQVEVHEAGEKAVGRESDLAFVVCEGDPEEVSVFFLREGKAWARARLPRSVDDRIESRARGLATAWRSGLLDPGSDLIAIGEDEGLLVLRYLRLHRDRLDRLHADDLPGVDETTMGLAGLALRERPAWEPWTFRSAADRIAQDDVDP